jgi:hypothetical protein
MADRHMRARSSPPLSNAGATAELAPASSKRIERPIDALKAPLVALARLLATQAARESLNTGGAVAPTESAGGADD